MSEPRNDEITAYSSIGADINKPVGKNNQPDLQQGSVGVKLPELSLEMSNEEISKLTEKWEKSWTDSTIKGTWEKKGDDNERYWLGTQFDTPKLDKTRPNVDNMIFESLETYLPQVTRRNPEPLVTLARDGKPVNTDPTVQGYVTLVKGKLGDLADVNKIRLKLKRATRQWGIYMIGVLKFGWDLDKDIPTTKVIRPKKLIFDPECTIDEDGYHGRFLGEHRKMEASKVIAIIGDTPENAKAIDAIKADVKQDLSTELGFIEWWTPQYMCWTLNREVLLKKKNPHWNYDQQTAGISSVDDFGVETPGEPVTTPGVNHFAVPKIPYEFLVVFSLDNQPMDNTGLITQNLSNQDRINKRNKQIDRNADRMNGGCVVSLERSGLTESQAKNVTKAVRDGGTVAIPAGSPQEAIYFPTVNGLPADVFNDLVDTRNRVRDIFGTRGSSPAGIDNEKTVRGKYVVKDLDTHRIGGGVSEYLEQLADANYNWWYQLLLVYDPNFQDKVLPKVVISVKEGSLLPQDSTTLANQAIDLASTGKMSNLDLYKKLEYPNPEEMAANAWLEINAPQILYANDPRIAQALEARAQIVQAEQMAKVDQAAGRQLAYDELPPSGKIQLAAKAGINITPDDIAIKDAADAVSKKDSGGGGE